MSAEALHADPTIGGEDPGLELDQHLAHPQLAKLWVAAVSSDSAGC